MKRHAIKGFLTAAGFPGADVSKALGVWYLVGIDGADEVERCLHCVDLNQITAEVINSKLREIEAELAKEAAYRAAGDEA